MGYQRTYRDFSAFWITAPEEYLAGLENFPELKRGNGRWIWPEAYVRGHLWKTFLVPDPAALCTAELALWCDNVIDVYLNGKLLSEGSPLVRAEDIACLLVPGDNLLTVRAFQTASAMYFTSAMRGGIYLAWRDGRKVFLPTDETWHCYQVCGFHRNREPDDWMSLPSPESRGFAAKKIICTDVHPRLLRRSCYYQKEILISGGAERARLYVSAKGVYNAYINGRKADSAVLSPGIRETCQEYCEMDVTGLLRPGINQICFQLGNGWLNCRSWGELGAERPAVIGELEILCEDGSVQVIGTDAQWMAAASPLLDNDLQFGERYDARLEEHADWCPAECLAEDAAHSRCLVRQDYPPIRKFPGEAPLQIRKIPFPAMLYDFGTNAAGRSRVVLRNCRRGEKIFIRYCERMDPGDIPYIGPYMDVFFPGDTGPGGKASFAARNLDVYCCRGDVQEQYEPAFTYTGFRYLYIQTQGAEIVSAERIPMYSDLRVTGQIDTSDTMIADLWEMITRSYRSNLFSGPTDCPTREKNFWNGDIQAFAHTACWYMDNSALLADWTIAGRKLEEDVYGWEDEEYLLPLTLYQFYGNRTILEEKFPAAERLLEVRESRMTSDLPFGMRAPYRDHKAVENGLTSDFFACCYYCLHLKMLARMAGLLGQREKEMQLQARFFHARDRFEETFYEKETGDFGQNCQSGQILPLALGLVGEDAREKVIGRLLYYIRRADDHLTTGYMTTPHLLPLLCDSGHAALAWKIFRQETFPSWRYLIDSGATTITEDWHGNASEDRYISLNHFSLGSVGQWFFEYLGGIRVGESGAGFSSVVLRPVFVRELGDFCVRYASVKGEIVSEWRWENDNIWWRVRTPEGVETFLEQPGQASVRCRGGGHELLVKVQTDPCQIVM